jgi:hypothetical protein
MIYQASVQKIPTQQAAQLLLLFFPTVWLVGIETQQKMMYQ